MASIDDLKEDVRELENFMGQASRQKVKSILTVEIHKLNTEISRKLEEKKAAEASGDPNTNNKTTKPARGARYPTVISTYAWDQSEKFFKVYITIKGVQDIPKENVTSEFTESSFKVQVTDLGGKDYVCHVANLHGEIVCNKSSHKVKTDTVLVMLKKQEEKTWPYVNKKDDKAKSKPPLPSEDKDKDPQAGLMDMMKQMYDDGDDEMKRTIAKSMYESQQKKSTIDMP